MPPQTIYRMIIITDTIIAVEMNAMPFPGEVLRMTHVARGLDSDGALLLDVIVSGYVLQLQSPAEVSVKVTSSKISMVISVTVRRRPNESPVAEHSGPRFLPFALQINHCSSKVVNNHLVFA